MRVLLLFRPGPGPGLGPARLGPGPGLGPGQAWAQARLGPGPGLGPGPAWARARLGPGSGSGPLECFCAFVSSVADTSMLQKFCRSVANLLQNMFNSIRIVMYELKVQKDLGRFCGFLWNSIELS